MAGRIQRTINFIKNLWNEDYLPTSRAKKTIRTILRIAIVSIKRFLDDNCLLWTATISYSVVVSFVPTMLAVLMFGAAFIDIEVFFDTLHEQARGLGLDVDLYDYKEPLESFIASGAKVVGGIGILVTLWSATNVFRNLEQALTFIFRVQKSRPFIIKVAQFILALIFGVPLLIFGLTITNSILDSFRAPDIHNISEYRGKLWAWGDKSHISYLDKGAEPPLTKFQPNELDWPGQSSVWYWNVDEKRPAEDSEVGTQELGPLVLADILHKNIATVIQTRRGLLIAYESGAVLRRVKGIWYLRKFALLKKAAVANGPDRYGAKPITFRTGVQSGGRIILSGKGGNIIFTDDFGDTWSYKKVATGNRHIIALAPGLGKTLWAVGENNLLLQSADGGNTWKPIRAIEKKLKIGNFFNYNTVFTSGASVYIGGTKSSLLISHDNGKTWQLQRIIQPNVQSVDVRGVYFKDKNNGVVFGRKGIVRYTENGGKRWLPVDVLANTNFLAVHYSQQHGLIAAGERSQVYRLAHSNNGYSVDIIEREDLYITWLGSLLNFVATFAIIFVLFLFVFVWLPYTRVSVRAAGVGAAFTSVVWVGFIFVFTFYVNNLAGTTLALYGAMAAIPLGLLLVYTSTAITLLGAELAYVVQFPSTYTRPDDLIAEEEGTDYMYYGFLILLIIYRDFADGNTPTDKDKLLRAVGSDGKELNKLIKIFMEQGYIRDDPQADAFIPMVPADKINLDELFFHIQDISYDIPGYSERNASMKRVRQLFNQVIQKQKAVLKDMSLADYLTDFKIPKHIIEETTASHPGQKTAKGR